MGEHENGICGYELNNPDRELFDTSILEVNGPCKDCAFSGSCLTPCESVRCLTPKNGKLVHLGREQMPDGVNVTYFALVRLEETRYVRLSEPEHYWANVCCIGREQVPDWALSRLRKDMGH